MIRPRHSLFLSVTISLALMAGLVAAPPARAQEHPNVARGFNPTASFDYAGVDNVNQFNGNLVIPLPLGQSYAVGGGLAWQLTLVYNSQVWMRQEYGSNVQSLPSPTNNALGWMVSLGRMKPPDYHGEPGDWVMNGPANKSNYILSGKYDPGPWNEFAPFASGREYLISGGSLRLPPGVMGLIKALLGQRIYMA